MTFSTGENDLSTGEGTLHYSVFGTGPACIWLGGGPGIDPRYVEDLGGIDDTVTLVVLHPRGAGLSRFPPDCDWSLSAYARDVETLRQHLGLERTLVLGHSHGGWIAQRYALDYPAGVGALILVGTAARGLAVADLDPEMAIRRYTDQPWFAAAHAALMEEDSPDITPAEAAANFQAVFPFYFASLTPEVQAFQARQSSLSVNPAPHVEGNGPAQFASDWRPELPSIQVPALVIVGRYDFIQTVAMAEELTHLIPQAHLAVFEESGHFPWVEERQHFHEVVHDFVYSVVKAT
jgi:proline iminopeptidase